MTPDAAAPSDPETPAPSDPIDLLDHGRDLLATARSASSGRAAHNLLPGGGQVVTQTMLALVADAVMADHTAPGVATLLVLDGSGVLTVDDDQCPVAAGQWLRLPERSHGLRAVTDLVCLLTVATTPRPASGNGAT